MKNITITLLVIGLLLGIGAKAQLPNVPHADYSKKTGTMTDPRDGKTYAYKKYGTTEWFMQNLNWDGYDGANESTKGTIGVWGSADPDGSKFGRFYPTQSAILCPSGWRAAGNEDWGTLIKDISDEHSLSDLQDTSGKRYTLKEFMKYLRGGELKANFADGLWEDGTGTLNADIANKVQFNALPMGEIVDKTGTSYVAGNEVGKRLWFLGDGKDRYYNNTTDDVANGINVLRHQTKAGAFGAVRCIRLDVPDVEIVTPYPTEIEIKQIVSTEMEVDRHKGRMKRLDHVFTGFYGESGKTLKIKLETLVPSTDGAKPQLVIGTRGQMPVLLTATNNNSGQMISEIDLIEGINTIVVPTDANLTGAGLLYFRYVSQTEKTPAGKVKVTFMDDSQQIRAPHYKYGVTSDDEFVKMLSEYNVPEVMFTSDEVVAVTSQEAAYSNSVSTDKKLWLDHLTKLMEIESDISGMDNSDPNPLHHRMKKGEIRHLFVQTRFSSPNASDWRVAYPSPNRYLTPFKTPTNGYSNVSWQVAHEIGHQHQQLAYLIPQAGESTVNIYSFKVASHFDDGGSAYHIRTKEDALAIFHGTYMKLPDAERVYEMDGTKLQEIIKGKNRDELRMVPWEIMFYAFGDDFYKTLHRITREEGVTNNGVSEQDDRRKVYLITRASLISGYDLRKYYDAWGIKVKNTNHQAKIDKAIKDANLQEPPRIDDLPYVSGTKFMNGDYAGWLPLPIKGIKTSVPANWTWEDVPVVVDPEDEPDFSYPSSVLADTYVTDIAGQADLNYGASDILDIKLNNVSLFHRQSYVKFALDDLDKYTDKENYDVKVFTEFFVTSANVDLAFSNWVLTPVADLTWKENEMTWNNKPAVGTQIVGQLQTFAPKVGTENPFVYTPENKVNINITEHALAEYAKGNKIISLNINNNIAGAKVNTTFASKEHAETRVHPVISVRLYKKNASKQDQTIAFPAIEPIEAGTTATAVAIATSGLAVTYTSDNTNIARIDATTGVITALSYGVATLTASQLGNEEFNPAPVKTIVLTVTPAATTQKYQFIEFSAPLTSPIVVGGTATAVATASSGLKVTYTSTVTTVATIDANTGVITALAVGNTSITASQAGNAEYLPATNKSVPLTVQAAPVVVKDQTITFPAIADITVGGTATAAATASSGLKVTYTSSDVTVATIDASTGVITALKAGPTTITASQLGNAEFNPAPVKTVNVTVKEAPIAGEVVLTINGAVWNGTSELTIACTENVSQIKLEVNEASGAKIKLGDKEATSHTVDLGIAPIQTISFSVIPQTGTTTNHSLVVNKGIQFDDITVTKWGNTYIVNKDPQTNGGLTITGYKWFENGVAVSTKQYYEATKGGTAAEYSVELTTTNGIVRTCPITKTPRIVLINVYPNPVKVGEPIYIDASQMPEDFFDNAKAYLYSLAGYTVKEQPVGEKMSSVEAPMTPGAYVLKIVSKTYSKEFKVIIK